MSRRIAILVAEGSATWLANRRTVRIFKRVLRLALLGLAETGQRHRVELFVRLREAGQQADEPAAVGE
jgi:hypothetical protein